MRDDYNTLVAEAGYLYDMRLSLSTNAGVTLGDLEGAQDHARAVIDEELAGVYCKAAWVQETPAIIERIADMLASARVMLYAQEMGWGPDARPSLGADWGLPHVLRREANGLLRMIQRGMLAVVDLQQRVASPEHVEGEGKTS